ncbi:uncharacterized protein LOC120430830 [Culex pipiens pallens]|uniref:uncharacterized protein LOC120430830 n=1 Tax=Culex pipiens pallens TaxID=42434 RepID=UPI001954FE8D|nr:uncharacterized protein LOC120430830 [Culex pipiens pallens]
MSSLLSSILKVVTSFEKKDLDTSGCKSAGDCPTLPPKLWTRIFLQLERYELLQVRMTCRSWKQLVDSNSGLREGFAISFPEGSIMDREYLPADLPPASKVTLRKVRIIEVGGWLPSLGNTLVHLCLSQCRVGLSTLEDKLRQTPKLKILELENIATHIYRYETITKPKLELNELECLVLDQIELVNFLSCPRLKVVKCTSIWLNKLAAFISSYQRTLQNVEVYYESEVIQSLTKLEHLKLKRLEFNKYPVFTTSGVITKLIELCRVQPTIEELLLPKEANGITCDHLKQIGSYLPRLKFLRAATVQEKYNTKFLTVLPCLKVLDWNTSTKVDYSGCSSPNLLEI